jgi:hypothetical protein
MGGAGAPHAGARHRKGTQGAAGEIEGCGTPKKTGTCGDPDPGMPLCPGLRFGRR